MERKGGFGEALREAAVEAFGSQRAYARAASLSPGRVSQIAGGREPNLQYGTLRDLLEPFTDRRLRERLYEAWREEFAPSPLLAAAEDPREALLAARALEGEGRTVEACRKLGELRKGPGASLKDGRLALEVRKDLASALFALGRHEEGGRIAAEMEELARRDGEPAALGTAVWLQGVALRPQAGRRPDRSEAAFRRLDDYLESWHPVSAEGRRARRDLELASGRDRAVAAWTACRFGRGDRDRLAASYAAFSRLLERADDPRDQSTGREVEARVLAALGRTDGAERALALAAEAPVTDSPAREVKLLLCEASISLRRENYLSARECLGRALSLCEERSLFHYHREAASLMDLLP